VNAAAATGGGFDVLWCSDFVNLPDLRALLHPELRAVPVLYYMHENQLGYPLSPDEEHDPYFGFTNVLSCLSAEAVAFNSEFHRRDFLARLPGILPRLPDYEPRWVVETITAKAEVLPIGLDVEALDAARPAGGPPAGAPARARPAGAPPRILWNHRWEFDKRPERFVAALERLLAGGVEFTADLVGESFARRPAAFDRARAALGARLGRFGWIESRAEYVGLLHQADVVVSTADQEYFGIAMAEAVLCGAHPIAPRGLVYADLYAGRCADRHLYRDEDELVSLLRRALEEAGVGHDCGIAARLRDLDWRRVGPLHDDRLAQLAGSR
jgi:glycosyltransferase involved in cell wall biosynthesis